MVDKELKGLPMELSEKGGVENNGFVQNEAFDDRDTDTSSQDEIPKTCAVDVSPAAVAEPALYKFFGMVLHHILLSYSDMDLKGGLW